METSTDAPGRRPVAFGVVALAILAGAVLLVGCGDGDGGDGGDDAARARLVDSLGFLGEDLGLTDDEVACVADEAEGGLGDEADVSAFATEVRRVDAGEVALDDLPDAAATALTDAIATCAGSS